ncbi:MAG TPA: hypothetical protein PLV68_12775, partial [Ilumatobacteraceae bacterium]|nr:hypothetical protein [Ilumatobacteraceae bacterium]
ASAAADTSGSGERVISYDMIDRAKTVFVWEKSDKVSLKPKAGAGKTSAGKTSAGKNGSAMPGTTQNDTTQNDTEVTA